ncbi:MFS transporter [Afipia sp. P52-10]|jgi:MFS family permease|uniref:MFS transporter n=1 Tax=Afipia sp. P52-10 TaxID=1429916 RepID=UPI0003DF4528|nr:MFS transporter [Afipia sp. P52-10]ETR75518.1 MFS transporter [Afipia sp. P52-10]
MNKIPDIQPIASDSITAPLRFPIFRRIWFAGLLTNLGLLIQGVGAAWAMTLMTSSPDMVALVQTAAMMPTMLISIAAGAIADMHDRRIVALVGLSIALASAVTLSLLAHFGLISPYILLAFSFLIGTGMALFQPAWQASVNEQVPPEALPQAVALNGISFNIARSFGPAIGGVIVAAAGAVAAFVCNALFYIPLIIVLLLWRREVEPSRLPPERLTRAIVSGVRYVIHSPNVRIVLTRTLLFGVIGGSVSALMPLLARDLLHGDARLYGIMLGAFGVGAVVGALNVATVRRRFGSELAVRASSVIMGLAVVVIAISRSPVLTAAALVVAGAVWMLAIALFNIGVQLSAPRWVAGRALAAFQAAIAGGIAVGSWGWGHVANGVGVGDTLLISGIAMLVSPLIGFWLAMPPAGDPTDTAIEALADPEVHMPLTARSGPIVIEIVYRIDLKRAREFYGVMQQVQLSRQRNGAYGWSIARDIADPEVWTERYHCPTWLDYLRQRNRPTQAERTLTQSAAEFHIGPEPVQVRRMLERPFGSVRWKDETPDRAAKDVLRIPVDPTSGT